MAPRSYLVILIIVLENSADMNFKKVVKFLPEHNPGSSVGSKHGHSDFLPNIGSLWEPSNESKPVFMV